MNVRAKGKNIDWKRIAGIAVVLLVVGYQYSRPTLEKWFDRDLPSVTGEDQQYSNRDGQSARGSNSSDRDADSRYDTKLPGSSSDSSSGKNNGRSGTSQKSSSSADGEYLRTVGRNRLMSPEGLLYTMGPRGEHRVDHVLRHGRDMPDRPVHSVFDGGKNDILAVIDEAYALAKADSPRARISESRGNQAYTVKMQRQIGYEGGQKGKRKGYPALKSVKLILDGDRVITAYPIR